VSSDSRSSGPDRRIGILTICIAVFFRLFTALGDAQRYVDERQAQEQRVAADAVTA
jgi:hypothetical protein